MAISYTLVLDTTESARHVAEVVRDVGQVLGMLNSSTTVEDVLAGCVTARRTWIRVVDGTSSLPWDVVEESFGFPSRVDVVFRQDKFQDGFLQENDMIRLVSGLFERIPGDAVLHLDLELVWLLRRGGELEVSARDDIWPAERLALLNPPYRRVTHHFA
jgi:hypothetical protein